MIRDEKFVLSRKPYAVDLGSLNANGSENSSSGRVTMRAVWFRRRRPHHGTGPVRTVACTGYLWDYMDTGVTAEQFLDQVSTSSYGGDCWARWDGETLWAPDATEDMRKEFLALLEPALKNYPEVPEGFDGWWHFPRP